MRRSEIVSQFQKQQQRLATICYQQNLLITALYSWLIFLIYEVTIRSYDLYYALPDIDLGGHFLAGIATTATLFWLLKRHPLKRKSWLVLCGVLIIGIFWEILESLQELVFYNPPYLVDIFIWDGFFDLLITMLAAGSYLLITNKWKEVY